MALASVGSFGYRRGLGIVSTGAGNGHLLIAGEAGTYDGPWDNPDKVRKLNAVVRYAEGTATDGLSLTAMAYANRWNATDQVPLRAIASGQIGLYGSIRATAAGPIASRCRDAGRAATGRERRKPMFT
jgi:hypothetical protein